MPSVPSAPAAATKLVIGFDADDTLWDNETAFAQAETIFGELARPWSSAEDSMAALIATERRNLHRYGYGVKGFVLAMIETLLELAGDQVKAQDLDRIVTIGHELLDTAPALLDNVVEVLTAMGHDHRVLIITKGDLHHQSARFEQLGLAPMVEAIEIVNEKDPQTYARVLAEHSVAPSEFVMVGNSLKSDVLPVIEIGGQAIHIPFSVTWALEEVDAPATGGWSAATSIAEVPGIVAALEAEDR